MAVDHKGNTINTETAHHQGHRAPLIGRHRRPMSLSDHGGTVLSKDSANKLYEVRDNADRFTVNVPMEDVKIIDHDRSDDPLKD